MGFVLAVIVLLYFFGKECAGKMDEERIWRECRQKYGKYGEARVRNEVTLSYANCKTIDDRLCEIANSSLINIPYSKEECKYIEDKIKAHQYVHPAIISEYHRQKDKSIFDKIEEETGVNYREEQDKLDQKRRDELGLKVRH